MQAILDELTRETARRSLSKNLNVRLRVERFDDASLPQISLAARLTIDIEGTALEKAAHKITKAQEQEAQNCR